MEREKNFRENFEMEDWEVPERGNAVAPGMSNKMPRSNEVKGGL